jgi:response regulator RpfG family c-di-GMP phosphodiesterase
MILEETGTWFDPAMVEIFLDVRGDIEAIQAEYLD